MAEHKSSEGGIGMDWNEFKQTLFLNYHDKNVSFFFILFLNFT